MLQFNAKMLLLSGRIASISAKMGSTLAILVVLALVCAPIRLVAAEFFASIDDLPLAPGLTELVEDGVAFDSPSGRIVTAVATGSASADAVRAFYRKALPSLGWSRAKGGTYSRDGEVLTLQLKASGSVVRLEIRVVPARPKAAR